MSSCIIPEIQSDGFRTLNEGERVTFETTQSAKGLQAVNVVRVEMANN